jgi:anti-sigma B factor antagonist
MNCSTATKALSLAGSLEIFDAESVRQALLDYLAGATAPVIDLGGVTSCDVAGLQLLCAATKTAAHNGRTIRFQNISEVVVATLRRAGLPQDLLSNPISA